MDYSGLADEGIEGDSNSNGRDYGGCVDYHLLLVHR